MAQYSVFDIAYALLSKAPGHTLKAVALQKLTFYVFGWYAHLTGEELFPQQFYAMQYGPVVGELLSAHAGDVAVGHGKIECQFAARGTEPQQIDPYVQCIIDAVYEHYSPMGAFELAELSHQESAWREAWDERDGKRGSMPSERIVEDFTRKPRPELALPLPQVSRITQEDIDRAETPIQGETPMVEALRRLVRAA